MEFKYDVVRSARKTVGIQVLIGGKVTVRVPYGISQKEIERILQENEIWLSKAIAETSERAKKQRQYTEEDVLSMRKRALDILPKKVEYYSEIMGVKPTAVKINSAKKRYGSCSGKNSINFSLYLMDKDECFIDYVVVHELAHIKYHNHSKEFYVFIEKYLPDYKERIKLEKN